MGCNTMYVEGVKGRSKYTVRVYVEGVERSSKYTVRCNTMYICQRCQKKLKNYIHTHIFAHNFLNIQMIFNMIKVLESCDLGLFNYL